MSSLFKKKAKPDENSAVSSPQVKQKGNVTSLTTAVNGSHSIMPSNGHTEVLAQERVTTTDPDTCLEVFKCHWFQACAILKKGNQENTSVVNRSPQEEIDTVIRYIDQMMLLLVEETDQNGAQGPILQYILEEDILTGLFECTGAQTNFAERLNFHHLKMIDMLISQSRQQLMVHKPIIRPVLQFLNSCQESPNRNVEQHLILVLHQLCVSVTQNTHLLEVLFSASSDQGAARFLIFSLLIPYIHHEGSIGQQARDALLLIMSLSSKHQNIGEYIAENSDFCPVLATGLSGLYSSLPRKLDPLSDDWYQISQEDVNKCPELLMFLNSLEFCNAVVQVAHPLVASQLLSFILQGFLSPVMGPALHQNDIVLPEQETYEGDFESVFFDDDMSSVEEVIAATAYLDLFLRRISEPALLCVFVKFVITDKYEDVTILDSLIARIQSNSRLICQSAHEADIIESLCSVHVCVTILPSKSTRPRDMMFLLKDALSIEDENLFKLCMVTLTLFKTLIDLNCEDIMFQLIFKYLIPCTHVMLSQRRAVRDVDMYGKTAEKLLSLKPNCCQQPSESTRSRQNSVSSQDSLQMTPTSLGSSFSFPTPNTPNIGTPTAKKRSWRNFGKNNSVEKPATNSTSAMAPSVNQPSVAEVYESNYIDYLTSARVRILTCAEACLYWSAPYDGEMPAPDSLIKKDSFKEEEAEMEGESSTQAGTSEITPKQVVCDSTKYNLDNVQTSDSSTEKNGNMETGALGGELDHSSQEYMSQDEQKNQDDKGGAENIESEKAEKESESSGKTITDGERAESESKEQAKSKCKRERGESQRMKSEEIECHKTENERTESRRVDNEKAESVSSETDSGLSGSSCAPEQASGGGIGGGNSAERLYNAPTPPRSDSPLNDTFDSADFNSFLLSLKRVQTPVEYSPSMEDCLNDIDALAAEYRKISLAAKSARQTSQSSQENVQSPVDSKSFERSLSKPLSPSTMDLSRDSCIYSLPKSGSMDSMSPSTPLKPSPSLLNLSASTPVFSPTKYNLGKPDIGPFLTTILSKLECMMQNSLYVNLLLSGLVTRLACYPQPLLRSFLLNHSLVFQPTVKSLVQVLSSVKHKVDNFALTVRDFEHLLSKARQFLCWREDQLNAGMQSGRGRSDSNLSLAPVTTSPNVRGKEKKKKSIGDFFRSKSKKPTQPRVQLVQTDKGFRYLNRLESTGEGEETNQLEALRTKNAVYCALVLEEFIKELSALSQEHAVLSPTLMHS